ncbi:malonate decarboxylase, epsilon subunit [Acinetobacter brisouii CIP 110357]|uniref:Malonyl CoA-acyl carrier protein transacylase n=1 Tax=Acinetobacter brisouii CIP 110357 TaxID=1341683 RepID=V2UQW8_9GAMM|nr:malonate decarboxylase subunit epsilon [Acinetobacter brisouii]ENV47971.1 malonate decarboxylase, epsilon subunit [Acinetobacter brisouii ANC 4119]ESK51055.1 malonate decarboxylase, epsilon subunit [Acinetobacter brisouii CIP 110357]
MSSLWVYPGQGVQKPNMLHDLPHDDVVQSYFSRASQALGQDVLTLDTPEALQSTRAVQLCLLIAGVLSSQQLLQKQLKPDYVAGLSIGAWAAAVVADVLSFEDAVRLVALRGELMQTAYPTGYGMTAIIGASRTQVEHWINQVQQQSGQVYVANINAANQIVISGENAAMQDVVSLAQLQGVLAKRLQVSVPSHCELLEQQAQTLAQAMQEVEFKTAKIRYLSSSTARLMMSASQIRQDLAGNMACIVEWESTVQAAWERGVRLQLELLPGTVLTGLARRIFKEGSVMAFQGTRLDNIMIAMQQQKESV